VLDDRLAEGLSLARVRERRVERRPRHADRLRGDADAPAFEVRQRDPVAFTLGAEQARRRDLAVSKAICAVSDARCPSFSSMRATTNPGVFVSTTNAEIPLLPAALSVRANTIATSAFAPLVMNCLTPFRTYASPRRSARVAIAAASDPVCGSVRQKQPRRSPRASGGSRRSFCASVPNA